MYIPAYTHIQCYKEALSDLTRVLALEPGNIKAVYRAAVCHRDLGRGSTLIHLYMRVIYLIYMHVYTYIKMYILFI